jgi:chromosome transmission fidelity protein 1
LLAWPVSNGVDGSALDFTFEKRSQSSVLESLGKSLIALAHVIPHGLVAFFPSYGYLSQCIRAWTPSSSGIWTQLSGLKELFTDSKEVGKVDDILRTYSDAVFRGNGAMLFSVMGGKMSEGINFSDELGRGIAIIGLPFPNVHSIEWKTKLQYVQQRTVSRGGSQAEGPAAARAVYENACMRAVNQSIISRAIRHQKDYANIFMLDRRYAAPRIQNKLPGWIQKRVMPPVESSGFGEMVDGVRRFYEQPRQK